MRRIRVSAFAVSSSVLALLGVAALMVESPVYAEVDNGVGTSARPGHSERVGVTVGVEDGPGSLTPRASSTASLSR